MSKRFHIVTMSSVVAASVVFASARGVSQAPPDAQANTAAQAALAKANFEATARVLTTYDAQGKTARTVGDRAVYNWATLSPDGTRLAVSRRDETTRIFDIWVLDVSTGKGTRITSDPTPLHTAPIWSPDGSQIVYASNPGGSPGLYRRAANGSGSAELLYQHPIGPNTTDWSADGRFLTFYAGNPSSLYVLPLDRPAGTTAIEVVPSQFRARGGRFSPDGRFLAYVSGQAGRSEVWVRRFDPAAPGGTFADGPWRISDRGGEGMVVWRQDGREIYYLATGGGVMAVEVNGSQTFKSGKPRPLFNAPDAFPVTQNPISGASISRDGRQFLFSVPPKPRGAPYARQLTVFDRRGHIVRTLGARGAGYSVPALSPDGTHVAALRDRQIHVFNVSSGTSTHVTASTPQAIYQGAPVWSPDGKQLISFSQRERWSGLYRQASNGPGPDELLYSQLFELCAPLTDWSADGRFLTFGGGGVLWTVPVNGGRKAIEFLREEFWAVGARFSPDSRYVAYVSNESDRYEIYVRSFDTATGAAGTEKWQLSSQGGLGLIQWRADGRELYYLAHDGGLMSVDVTTQPTFRAGEPKLLFRVPVTIPLVGTFVNEGMHTSHGVCGSASVCGENEPGSVSRDGRRFVFTVPTLPARQEVVVPRRILEQYVGTYHGRQPGRRARDLVEWVVTLEDGSLMIRIASFGLGKARLFAESETRFFLKASNGDFEFVKDDKGEVAYLFMYRGGTPTQLIRNSRADPN